MTSLEMLLMFCLLSILHLSACIPVRWMAVNTHTFPHHKWSPHSMGRAVDTLESSFTQVIDNRKKILDENFMMHIFDGFSEEIIEFDEFITFKFKEQTTTTVGNCGDKVYPYGLLCVLSCSHQSPRQTMRQTWSQ